MRVAVVAAIVMVAGRVPIAALQAQALEVMVARPCAKVVALKKHHSVHHPISNCR